MRAELQGKLDPATVLEPQRLEDTLTDAVFSAVRYLPRRVVLASLLARILPGQRFEDRELDDAVITFWPQMMVGLLPGRRIEPDVVVEVGGYLVAFEAKYRSPFGRYEVGGLGKVQQLTVQWHAVSERAAARNAVPVVVAVTPHATEPEEVETSRTELTVSVVGRDVATSPTVSWLPWRAFADVLRAATGLQVHEKAVRDDAVDLMERRGVAKMFTGFDIADYQQVAAARQVAAERLYPVISTFVQELTSELEEEGVAWGWPQKGMWTAGGLGWTRPQEWARDHFAAAYWPTAWPKRRKPQRIALYVLFDFVRPGIEVGYVQQSPGSAEASKSWSPHLADLAGQLNALPSASCSFVADAGDWTAPAAELPVHDVSPAALTQLSGYAHLRLAQRLALEDVQNPTIVRDAVRRVRLAVDACPAFHTMLSASDQIEV